MASNVAENKTDVLAAPASQKYDRQIRIWGEQGQTALERASVCVLGSGPTATETLKNLVLPGIGAFTVVDAACVSAGDFGNNFFVACHLTKSSAEPVSRAAAATQSLLELNDRVEGSYIAECVSGFLGEPAIAASFFEKYSLVIATQMGTTDATLRTIAEGCQTARVPLVVVRSYGLIGSLRIQVPELCVVNAHDDSAPADLRLHMPFASLAKFVDSYDFDTITDATTAAHVPFIVILIKALARFRVSEGCDLPNTRAEKDAFKAVIAEMQASSVCGTEAENFEEAMKYSNLRLCYSDAADVPCSVSTVLADAQADPNATPCTPRSASGVLNTGADLPVPTCLSPRVHGSSVSNTSSLTVDVGTGDENASFWVHAAAVRAFAEANGGVLPVAGVVPDMTADTKSYIALQNIYKAKAEADAAQVYGFAVKIAERRGLSCRVDGESSREFCKQLSAMRVIRCRPVKDEASTPRGSSFVEEVDMNCAADASNPNSALSYYILLRAVDRFCVEHGWYPGQRGDSVEDDKRLLKDCVAKVCAEYGGSIAVPGIWSDETEEMLRFSNEEMHNVASYMGGIAAQEVVKILTKQFVPLNNTLIVNFSNLTSATFEA